MRYSQVVKTSDFDSLIRRFKSYYLSQSRISSLGLVVCETKCVAYLWCGSQSKRYAKVGKPPHLREASISCSSNSMVEYLLPKQITRVRSSSTAPANLTKVQILC